MPPLFTDKSQQCNFWYSLAENCTVGEGTSILISAAMFTMASASVKKFLLKNNFLLMLSEIIMKENNAPQAFIDLVIERVGLGKDVIHHT